MTRLLSTIAASVFALLLCRGVRSQYKCAPDFGNNISCISTPSVFEYFRLSTPNPYSVGFTYRSDRIQHDSPFFWFVYFDWGDSNYYATEVNCEDVLRIRKASGSDYSSSDPILYESSGNRGISNSCYGFSYQSPGFPDVELDNDDLKDTGWYVELVSAYGAGSYGGRVYMEVEFGTVIDTTGPLVMLFFLLIGLPIFLRLAAVSYHSQLWFGDVKINNFILSLFTCNKPSMLKSAIEKRRENPPKFSARNADKCKTMSSHEYKSFIKDYKGSYYIGEGYIAPEGVCLLGAGFLFGEKVVGLYEDLVRYILYTHSMISIVACDDEDATGPSFRATVWYVNNSFGWFIFVALSLAIYQGNDIDEDGYEMLVVSLFLINPIMLMTQKLLYWGVFCPCLIDETEPADDAATNDVGASSFYGEARENCFACCKSSPEEVELRKQKIILETEQLMKEANVNGLEYKIMYSQEAIMNNTPQIFPGLRYLSKSAFDWLELDPVDPYVETRVIGARLAIGIVLLSLALIASSVVMMYSLTIFRDDDAVIVWFYVEYFVPVIVIAFFQEIFYKCLEFVDLDFPGRKVMNSYADYTGLPAIGNWHDERRAAMAREEAEKLKQEATNEEALSAEDDGACILM